jgi:hypothetical protein
MILDLQSIFSDQQAITATAASTNVIDLGPNPLDAGWGNSIPLLVQVTETFNNLTSLAVALQASDDPAFGSSTTVFTETVLLANLKAGARIAHKVIPYNTVGRYLRLNYTVAGSTAPTKGKVTAGITTGNDETIPYR